MSPCRENYQGKKLCCVQTAWPTLLYRCVGMELRGKANAGLPTHTAGNCFGKFCGVWQVTFLYSHILSTGSKLHFRNTVLQTWTSLQWSYKVMNLHCSIESILWVSIKASASSKCPWVRLTCSQIGSEQSYCYRSFPWVSSRAMYVPESKVYLSVTSFLSFTDWCYWSVRLKSTERSM
jgi:hypothetical protein